MAMYKYSHKPYSPPARGGGNGILRMTDEIKTVLLTTYSPTHPGLHFPLILSGCPHPAAAAASFYWLRVFALASHSSAEARETTQKPPLWTYVG